MWRISLELISRGAEVRFGAAHRRLGVDDLSEAMDVPRGGRQMKGSHLESDGNFEKLGNLEENLEKERKMTGK